MNANDTIRLVDFGTARARLIAQPDGRIGIQRSSIYGTSGYAPPEQYRGKSEPRSDVYALAATLYHLATNDHPGNDPFKFPRCEDLGLLGEALKSALEHDPQRRPDAATFRATLEKLPTFHPLVAPDSSCLYNEQAVVRWCQMNWLDAQKWLFSERNRLRRGPHPQSQGAASSIAGGYILNRRGLHPQCSRADAPIQHRIRLNAIPQKVHCHAEQSESSRHPSSE